MVIEVMLVLVDANHWSIRVSFVDLSEPVSLILLGFVVLSTVCGIMFIRSVMFIIANPLFVFSLFLSVLFPLLAGESLSQVEGYLRFHHFQFICLKLGSQVLSNLGSELSILRFHIARSLLWSLRSLGSVQAAIGEKEDFPDKGVYHQIFLGSLIIGEGG